MYQPFLGHWIVTRFLPRFLEKFVDKAINAVDNLKIWMVGCNPVYVNLAERVFILASKAHYQEKANSRVYCYNLS